jgi:hypothetical protein
MYLPNSSSSVGTGHLLPSATVLAALTSIQKIIQAYNTANLPNSQVVVLSGVASTALPVTAVSADQRVDIQRRRANQQAVGVRQTAAI